MACMSPRRALSAIAILSVLALGAAGCASEPEAGPSTPPTSSTPTPTPTATDDSPGERPALSTLVLTTEGLGELTFTAPPPTDDPDTNLVSFDPTACATETPSSPGLWVSNYDD